MMDTEYTPFKKKMLFLWSIAIIAWMFTLIIWGFTNEGRKDVMRYEVEKLRIEKGVPEPVHIDIIE